MLHRVHRAASQPSMIRRLDKTKFLYVGAGLFSVSNPANVCQGYRHTERGRGGVFCQRPSNHMRPCAHAQGVTTCLYPLSVIKTRQMALAGSPPGLSVRAHVLPNP